MRRPLGALLLSLVTAPAVASDFTLQWPLDCRLGETCHIQQYVDHVPGPGSQDYQCQGLSYSGHKGTDIALPYLSDMQVGVKVRAAAPGIVQGVRNTMPDAYSTAENAELLQGRECGNGVVLRHEGGWETQYCHMRQGSVRVQKGQRVAAGTALGEVGLSGKTQFPHLHLSLRQNGTVIDPFAPEGRQACNSTADPDAPNPASLWADPIEYQPGGFLGAGFAAHVPEFQAIKSGEASGIRLTTKSPALVFWAYAFGGQKGDRIRLTISGPKGVFSVHEITLERDQAQFFRASGKRLRSKSWDYGRYTALAVLLRDDEEIDRIEEVVDLR
ncbi:M23 family metallopeptidase [Pseudophaeobacter sp. EL27]|uniref:M23 family metallopeptidase n=1 Tax=Pseudophaeobacter sp. EL27 TaxID=2107580 RepID=UPI000EFBB014|nr:M23 family metallopeptidase [Pseudophaeobacter sp. EL27]